MHAFCSAFDGFWLSNVSLDNSPSSALDLASKLLVLLGVSNENIGGQIWLGKAVLGDQGAKLSRSSDNKDIDLGGISIELNR